MLAPLYEDNHLLVVNKPFGLLTQGDSTGRDSLLEQCREYVRRKYNKPGNVFIGMVHRLDRPAGGVMVFARTSKGASRLSAQIRDRTFDKRYYALVEGELAGGGRCEDQLVRIGSKSVVADSDVQSARRAVLDYEVVVSYGGFSLVDIRLITGRKHQIRAQMASIGHPVAGDTAYGARDRFGPDRIALLGRRIEFRHPTRDERLSFTVPVPDWWPLSDR